MPPSPGSSPKGRALTRRPSNAHGGVCPQAWIRTWLASWRPSSTKNLSKGRCQRWVWRCRMIRRLTLINWRNYEDVTIRFGAGTTFVVAPNGVGKTSLVEAARWALFGVAGPSENGAVRAGSDTAQAVVELVL